MLFLILLFVFSINTSTSFASSVYNTLYPNNQITHSMNRQQCINSLNICYAKVNEFNSRLEKAEERLIQLQKDIKKFQTQKDIPYQIPKTDCPSRIHDTSSIDDLQPVYSMYNGKVSMVTKKTIIIHHQNTMDYAYQCVDKITAIEGEEVTEDSIIGYVRNIEDLQVIATNGIT